MTAVTDNRLTSDLTEHYAKRIAIRRIGDELREYWRVSWCPDRVLTRDQATKAMLLAECVAALPDDRHTRARIVCLAATLDIPAPEAAQLAKQPAHSLDRRYHDMSRECWCGPVSALEGHRNDDGTDVEFIAGDTDAVTADGRIVEVVP
jgi:hypothetical protein